VVFAKGGVSIDEGRTKIGFFIKNKKRLPRKTVTDASKQNEKPTLNKSLSNFLSLTGFQETCLNRFVKLY
jgi:hypothetical protein